MIKSHVRTKSSQINLAQFFYFFLKENFNIFWRLHFLAIQTAPKSRSLSREDNDYEEENKGDGVDNRGSGMELSSQEQEVRVSGSGVRDEEDASFALFDMGNDKIAPQDQALSTSNSSNNDDDGGDEVEEQDEEGSDGMGISSGSGSGMVASGGDTYKSLLSEFDDFVANEKNGAMAGTSRALSYGFVVGDMVWGKVKSHPWWPGHIFNEELASSSVRRTRREGHVLVAFFGDSSYGWFDPAELIPFEVHFAEKSQQTNQKNFVKAVEEAVDEASRRYGLGLTCKCRNPYNFRPANVQGYFAVDVLDFEPGGIYSVDQIKKARDEFRPGKTLEFLKQVAMRPQEFDGNTIDFTKYSAAICTFRKAVFEEYDETYAQAFGAPPSRPANDKAKKYDEPVKIAPLSGPLVIAEALGGRKNSNKFLKGKDSPKKDRYLLKKRVEPSDSRELQSVPKQPSSSSPAVYVDGLSGIAGSDYVLQKRDPEPNASVKHEQISLVNKEGADPSDVTGNEIASLNQAPGLHGALYSEGSFSGANPSLDMEKGGALQLNQEGLDMGMDPANDSKPDFPGKGASQSLQPEGDPMVDHRHEGSANVPMSSESSHKIEVNFSARAEGDGGLANLQGSYPGPLEFKHSAGTNAGALIKKAKILKRSMGALSSENSVMGEKKKKRKKEFDAETSPGRPPKKRFSTGKGGMMSVNLAGKSTHISLAARDDPRVNHQKKVTATLPMLGVMNMELDSQKLLSDLHALALDPFHGAERSGSSIAMQFFLRFRSLVYQKSLFLPPQSETAGLEVRPTKSSSISGLSDNSVGGGARDITASRPVKSISRPEDPTKAGRKRMPSDRQEEIAAKRSKKIAQLKSLSTEKKITQKSLEIQRAEGKEPVAPGPPRPKAVKMAPVKKMEPPVRAAEPTMLVMKFPPETSLPSVAELKARFARFGTLDQSAIRVFWTSSQCRVVFRRKLNAQAAYRYAISNATLFGNVAVRYNLREVGAPASDAPESDTSIDASRSRDPASAILHQPLSQSPVQIKSILKKPPGDEAAAQASSGRMTPRVKFMLGGEESTSRGEQLMMVGNRNFNSSDNNASFADGGASSTSVAMDINSKNFQKVIPPPSLLPPLLPFPPQFGKAPVNNSQHTTITTAAATTTTTVIAPRNMHNPPLIAPPPPPPSNIQSVDISQQMLNLLTRCNDVVSSVTGLLGYVPYHPL